MIQPPIIAATDRRRITVMQGQAEISDDPNVEFTTVLGSCVSTCLFDPDIRLGGMNHFLLAQPAQVSSSKASDVHYGVYLMEVLINKMLVRGSIKKRLQAHLYGGAQMYAGLHQIGLKNAAFAHDFLKREGITVVERDLGGTTARRVNFNPARGTVQCIKVADQLAPEPATKSVNPAHGGEVEFFWKEEKRS